ncbi:MAG: hypothetical protein WCR42_15460 [bacterium]
MKKLILLSFAIMILANINAYSLFVPGPQIIINKSGGQENYSLPGFWTGYEFVNCTHVPMLGSWTHTKNCNNPGLTPCDWDINPANWPFHSFGTACPGGTQDMEDYVKIQIANEVYSGSYNTIVVEDGTTYYKFLDWEYDPLTDLTEMVINVSYESN